MTDYQTDAAAARQKAESDYNAGRLAADTHGWDNSARVAHDQARAHAEKVAAEQRRQNGN